MLLGRIHADQTQCDMSEDNVHASYAQGDKITGHPHVCQTHWYMDVACVHVTHSVANNA